MKNGSIVMIVLLLLSSATAFGGRRVTQPIPPTGNNRQFYTEFGGPGVIFSANYDQRFTAKRTGLGFRIGLGYSTYQQYYHESGYYYGSGSLTKSLVTLPLGLNCVLGKATSSHAFEVGAGVTLLSKEVGMYYYEDSTPGHVIGWATFMYRKVPVFGGFTWRIGFMPVVGTSGDIVPSAAVGFGYAF